MNYRNKQQGVVLVIALIALVAISLAGVALMRTVDTSNVISGNIAFNEAAIQIADIGAELAYAEVNTNLYYQHNADGSLKPVYVTLTNPAPNQNPLSLAGYSLNPSIGCEFQTSCPAYYYMTLQSNPQNWYSVAANQVSPALPSGYSLQYRIERMCAQSGWPATFKNASGNENCRALPIYTTNQDVTNSPQFEPNCQLGTQCALINPLANSFNKILPLDANGNSVSDANGNNAYVGKLFYRITVKVTGPKDTTAQAQYFYGIQDYIKDF